MALEDEWVNLLWNTLGELEPPERVRVSGDWIIFVTQTLLSDLGRYRREQVASILEEPDWDPQKLAETIGGRTEAIRRLAKEGRRNRGETSS
jgi:hypothetical protein